MTSGKEATIYCCRAAESTGFRLVAAKIYRTHRTFRNDAVYRQGQIVKDRRARRSIATNSRFGREIHATSWARHEFEILRQLQAAGADVPQPLAGPIDRRRDPVDARDAILMEYIGERSAPAQELSNVSLSFSEAQELLDRVLSNIELWLSCNVVHADLSPFNILLWEGRLVVIDFPQAVDARFNPSAWKLLERDLENVCRYFARHGIQADSRQLAQDLWTRFMRAEL